MRPWPSPFVLNDENNDAAKDYYAFRLIGLADTSTSVKLLSPARLNAVQAACDNFLLPIRAHKMFDSWINISIVRSSNLNDVRVDLRDWGFASEPVDSDDESDEENEYEPVNSKKDPKKAAAKAQITSSPDIRKLRPASGNHQSILCLYIQKLIISTQMS